MKCNYIITLFKVKYMLENMMSNNYKKLYSKFKNSSNFQLDNLLQYLLQLYLHIL